MKLSVIFILTVLLVLTANAQSTQDLSLRPIYVTARIFQAPAVRGGNQELSDQVFKMRTESLSDDEKWINAFKKTYPGLEIKLIRAESRRVFRTSKPSAVNLARLADGRTIELAMTGAQSVGDGEKPGTTLVSEISLKFGENSGNKPLTYSIIPLEVDNGMTYFYSVNSLKMAPAEYAAFFRPNAPVKAFDKNDTYLIIALSVDLDKTVEPLRYLDERQSMQLQERATKKVEPEVPPGLRQLGLGGLIRVRVEISSVGKVTSAHIRYSSLPELNREALAAARQWEFPATLFAEDKNPITGFIAFRIAAK